LTVLFFFYPQVVLPLNSKSSPLSLDKSRYLYLNKLGQCFVNGSFKRRELLFFFWSSETIKIRAEFRG
jgi:hypothetical protein